ncbi:uncharacterized protein LOC124260758 [Haliotis rubra]|uniref:uncharacterized protein LOC124260758 n=1 Tax=Haliotis rubra TaxID=36100 RepID=UPI001EE53EF6|nr:uncharacterized protein LOC124260758 [Haliotis rubra]XP_046551037.1 uncharacterized protein LOC124260758 [Haliotis rubra]XP_046551042.1 uncharacterized protein LOC124260758 [Haliotis rubra]XP_046551050.1 uncharacterized protein LOC124260758 [Haliotis rubra]XP_046551057.1 uncharacterized protein LOC124260758 [Haliotis rubra]
MERHQGMCPHRATSPVYVPEKKVRRRRNDPGTEEIIRFVREFQLEKQPTLLRLQRRAPLPGIGEVAPAVSDSGYVERTEVSDSDDDPMLDSEIAAIEDNAKSLRRTGSYLRLKSDSQFKRRSSVNSRSYQHLPSKSVGRTKFATESMYNSFGGLRLARQNTLVKQLPPIRRQEIPERPSAPSPSVTPPLPGEDLDSAGEPVDFIDPA